MAYLVHQFSKQSEIICTTVEQTLGAQVILQDDREHIFHLISGIQLLRLIERRKTGGMYLKFDHSSLELT